MFFRVKNLFIDSYMNACILQIHIRLLKSTELEIIARFIVVYCLR